MILYTLYIEKMSDVTMNMMRLLIKGMHHTIPSLSVPYLCHNGVASGLWALFGQDGMVFVLFFH